MIKTFTAALLASFISAVALADEIKGRAVSVADADTITVGQRNKEFRI